MHSFLNKKKETIQIPPKKYHYFKYNYQINPSEILIIKISAMTIYSCRQGCILC